PGPRDSEGGRNVARLTAASATEVPVLLRQHAAWEKLWQRAPGSGLPARAHAGGMCLEKARVDAHNRPRPALVAATASRHGWPWPREHPWSPLLTNGVSFLQTIQRV